jgi:glutamyl-tRNA reductase
MTAISCLSIAGCRASLDLLEKVAYPPEELGAHLPVLLGRSHARGLAVLSTCQRTEIYATWADEPDAGALRAALAADRGIPAQVLDAAATTYFDEAAARHLFRVAAGLESFVLGETEIAGQVRAAAVASRLAGGNDVVLDRLLSAAIHASRHAHRRAPVAAAGRSVASVALDAIATSPGGSLAGRRLLVVGAGQVARVVVARATALGSRVTVCNRTRRRAERLTATGATVVDLSALAACLAETDIAVLATAAPHPLVDAAMLRSARTATTGPLTLIDLSLPRNVDARVRDVPSVRLFDLADLRAAGAREAAAFAAHVAAAEAIIETELARYARWSAGRSVAAAMRQMRGDAERVAREEIARIADGVPEDARPAVERAVLRTVGRLVHGPTRELLAAAQNGDTHLVSALARLYVSRSGSAAHDPHATTRLDGSALDAKRAEVRAREQATHQRGVHATDELAV